MAVAAVGLVHRTSRTHQKRLVEVAVAVAVVAVAAGCCSQIVTHQTSCCPAAGVAVAELAAVAGRTSSFVVAVVAVDRRYWSAAAAVRFAVAVGCSGQTSRICLSLAGAGSGLSPLCFQSQCFVGVVWYSRRCWKLQA